MYRFLGLYYPVQHFAKCFFQHVSFVPDFKMLVLFKQSANLKLREVK